MVRCIACRSEAVELVLDLGQTSLANKFLAADELDRPEPTYPLRVGFCGSCNHVQLMEPVPPPAMFDHYLYISSASSTLTGHLHSLAARVIERCTLTPADLMVDVGSNDGTLLSLGVKRSIRTLGIDPAANLAALARDKGVTTMTAYFGADTARRMVAEHGQAKAITATNVFPHLPDLADFLTGLDIALTPDGTFVLEAHYLQDLLDAAAFDTVYHEHCSYWALRPMLRLFAERGFAVVDVERLPIHHGQLRVWVRRVGIEQPSARVAALAEDEIRRGMDTSAPYVELARNALRIRAELSRTIDELRRDGKQVVGYGAPAKGTTLLTFLDIGPDRLNWIADKSPLKQGRFTPGLHVPIVPAERLLAERPDYVLLLAWNFADEIMAEQSAYRAGGGRFILPVPQVRIV